MSAQDKTGAPSGAPTADEHLELVGEFDATKWASVFVRTFPGAVDEETMVGWFANAIMSGYDHAAKERRAQIRELNVALNGIAAAPQAPLCDLIAQVRNQDGVRVLNMSDGMRINFRAPDGRRATLFLGPLLDAMESNGRVVFEPGIAGVMREAIKAYPCAGDPLPAQVAPDVQASAEELCGVFGHTVAIGKETCQYCGVKP